MRPSRYHKAERASQQVSVRLTIDQRNDIEHFARRLDLDFNPTVRKIINFWREHRALCDAWLEASKGATMNADPPSDPPPDIPPGQEPYPGIDYDEDEG